MTKDKSMKVYEVVFGEFIRDGEESGDFCGKMDSKIVLGEDVESAISSAKEMLSKKESKTYYVVEVIHQNTLD